MFSETKKTKDSDNMDVDSVEGHPTSKPPTLGPQGTKRKVVSSSDNAASMTQHIDPQLVGPGMSSGMTVGSDGPAPKRRGPAAVDTQKISQLSLYDRRNPADPRAGPSGTPSLQSLMK
jgi:hypothetical protein